MKYINLGRSGLKVSRICLGTMTFGTKEWNAWTIDEPESREIIRRSLDLGINFFDTADVYSIGASEEIVGRALKDFASRREIVIATKVHGAMGKGPNDGGLSRKHILDAVDASLRRLGTDYIDLYQIHRWDYDTPIEETLEALNDLVRSGKVRYLGASSMFAWEFARALHLSGERGWSKFVSMQNHYNLVYREEEREMIPLCLHEGIGIIPWSPLARGFLTGKWKGEGGDETVRALTDRLAHQRYYQPEDFAVQKVCAEIAQRADAMPAHVAMAWLLAKPGVTAPIVGATRISHIEDAVAALDLSLGADAFTQLEAHYRPHPVLGHQGPNPSPSR